jgi:hypothetical protein
LCSLDGRDGAIDNKFEVFPEDFAGVDLDGNQLSDQDGELIVITFVDDDSPVEFNTDKAYFKPFLQPVNRSYICDTEDEDCDDDGVQGDGAVIMVMGAILSVTLDRGEGIVDITQDGITYPTSYLVTGESDSIEFTVLEATVQAGLNEDSCELPGDAAGFLDALGEAEKTVVLTRVTDSDGQTLTGAFVEWLTDEEDRGIFATNLTPTLDLGTFGFGAPNIFCGVEETGQVVATANLLDPAGESLLTELVAFNLFGDAETTTTAFTIAGAPANMTLSAAPAELACDGIASSTVTATVTDVDGNPVVTGNEVTFSVQVLGTANPIVATTGEGGVATSVVTPLATGTETGVPVVVTVGDVESSILVNCTGAVGPGTAPPPPPPGGGTPGTGISGPDTGTGPGEVDGAGALSWWPVLALVAGAAALATLRFAVRRI